MEQPTICIIDDLGRIKIPKEFRDMLGIGARDEIEMNHADGDTTTLYLSKYSDCKGE